eukprot:3009602-Amphidinium_carterae.1
MSAGTRGSAHEKGRRPFSLGRRFSIALEAAPPRPPNNQTIRSKRANVNWARKKVQTVPN